MTGACYRETPVPTRSPTVTTSTATAATSIQTRRITRYLYKIHASFGAPARGGGGMRVSSSAGDACDEHHRQASATLVDDVAVVVRSGFSLSEGVAAGFERFCVLTARAQGCMHVAVERALS